MGRFGAPAIMALLEQPYWHILERMAASETVEAARCLGVRVDDPYDVALRIEAGLPGSALHKAARLLKVSLREIGEILDIPSRSLARKARARQLSPEQSDQVFRLARIYAFARTVLGDDERALRWLRKPNRSLGGRIPLRAMKSEPAARLVEDALGRIAYGVFS